MAKKKKIIKKKKVVKKKKPAPSPEVNVDVPDDDVLENNMDDLDDNPDLDLDPAEEEELLNDDMGDDTPDEKPAVVTSVTGPPSNVPDTLEPDEEEEGDLMAILDQHGELKVREAFDRMGYQDSGDTPRRVKGLLEQLVQRGFVNYRWKDAAGRYSLTLAGEAHLASLRS